MRWFFFPYEAVGARGGGGDVAARPLDRTRVMRTRRGDDQSHEDDANRGSPDDPYCRFGPVHTCLYVRVLETGDWDLFLGPLERARAETGGAD